MLITTCGNSELLAKKLAKQLRARYVPVTIAAFPDGDLYLRYPVASLKGQTLVIVESFQPNPNETLLHILFAAETAKDLGAKKVILVAPYLAFLRQDARFKPGEAVSSQVMAKLLSNAVDKIITIDPHLHRYASLNELFTIPGKRLTADPLLAEYIKRHYPDAVLVGPDWESSQWAAAIARSLGMASTTLQKKRLSPTKVQVRFVDHLAVKGKTVVLVDDILSTGKTIAAAAREARKRGARRVVAIAVHGVFVPGAFGTVKKAGVSHIITANTIVHPTNKIDITPLLAAALRGER
ncbi:ribose-phosphate diphosphokinase [Candidatus Woesearchaeota archaeon]|nr:ribose-phosphate diphosphokinase [Candidatus Woesearchaeota archaeon]